MKLTALFAALVVLAASGTGVAQAPPAGAEAAPYRVVDGNKVDARTMGGWRAWRAAACDRCHGRDQQGMVGPSLVESLKTMSKKEFMACVLEGRAAKGMPNFDGSPVVVTHIDGLYGFLKGRSDGMIESGRLQELQETEPSATPGGGM